MQCKDLNATLIAATDIIIATADGNDISIENSNIAAVASTVADFAYEVTRLIAEGHSPDAPEVVRYFQWTVMKLVELNSMMPEPERADLSFECFLRYREALAERHGTTSTGAH